MLKSRHWILMRQFLPQPHTVITFSEVKCVSESTEEPRPHLLLGHLPLSGVSCNDSECCVRSVKLTLLLWAEKCDRACFCDLSSIAVRENCKKAFTPKQGKLTLATDCVLV